jgi:hypothetical protein
VGEEHGTPMLHDHRRQMPGPVEGPEGGTVITWDKHPGRFAAAGPGRDRGVAMHDLLLSSVYLPSM